MRTGVSSKVRDPPFGGPMRDRFPVLTTRFRGVSAALCKRPYGRIRVP
jgi:hypothetical protein